MKTATIYAVVADWRGPPWTLLEVQPLNASGTQGFSLAVREEMQRDFRFFRDGVLPSLAPLNMAILEERQKFSLKDIEPFYRGQVSPDHPGILYPTIGNMTREDFLFIQEHPEYTVINSNPWLYLLMYSKGLFATMMRKITAPHFPPTAILERHNVDHCIDQIHKELTTKPSHYIIKPNNSSNGTGARLTSQKDLRKTLKRMIHPSTLQRWKGDFWALSKQQLFVAQPYTRTTAIEKNGKLREGTLRTVATLSRNHPDEPFDIRFHGAYWKLAPKPLHNEINADQVISFSAGRREGLGHLWRISRKKPKKSTKNYALATEDQLNSIMPIHNDVLNAVLNRIEHLDPAETLYEAIRSNDRVVQRLAATAASSSCFMARPDQDETVRMMNIAISRMG